jgi:hypothetical protein
MKASALAGRSGPENVCPIVPDRYDSAKAGEWTCPMTYETLVLAPGHDEEEIRR